MNAHTAPSWTRVADEIVAEKGLMGEYIAERNGAWNESAITVVSDDVYNGLCRMLGHAPQGYMSESFHALTKDA